MSDCKAIIIGTFFTVPFLAFPPSYPRKHNNQPTDLRSLPPEWTAAGRKSFLFLFVADFPLLQHYAAHSQFSSQGFYTIIVCWFEVDAEAEDEKRSPKVWDTPVDTTRKGFIGCIALLLSPLKVPLPRSRSPTNAILLKAALVVAHITHHLCRVCFKFYSWHGVLNQ